MRKKGISLAVILILILISNSLSFASEYQVTNMDANQRLINLLNNCFEKTENVEVLNADGNNVTEQFLNQNYTAYISKDYESIKKYIRENKITVSCIIEESHNTDVASPYALSRSKTVTRDYVVDVGGNGILTGFYAMYSIRGTFHYEPNSGLITSTGNTTIYNIDFVDKPAGIYARAENISTRAPQIIDGGYTALFQGSLRFCGYSNPDYVELAEDYGYFSASVTGQAD